MSRRSFLTHSLPPVLAADAAYHYEWSPEARFQIISGSAPKLFGRVVATLDSTP